MTRNTVNKMIFLLSLLSSHSSIKTTMYIYNGIKEEEKRASYTTGKIKMGEGIT